MDKEVLDIPITVATIIERGLIETLKKSHWKTLTPGFWNISLSAVKRMLIPLENILMMEKSWYSYLGTIISEMKNSQ